jgi:hypothetical protein
MPPERRCASSWTKRLGWGLSASRALEFFVEGDRIEAYVKPDGVAWSITALKQQQGQPGLAGAPGD